MQSNELPLCLESSFPKSTVGGYIFAEDDTVLFFCSHKWPGLFSTPGGKIQEGETVEEAFNREIFEETGLRVTDVQFLSCQDVVHSRQHYLRSHMIFHNFTARLAHGYAKDDVILNDEAESYCWMSIEEALKKPLTQEAYSDLKRLIKQSACILTLKEITVFAFLGVYPQEQQQKQLVYFTVRFPCVIPKRDSLEEVINYEEIVTSLKELCEKTRFSLVETLAYCAASMLKRRFCLSGISLSVRKEQPLSELTSAEVTVEL